MSQTDHEKMKAKLREAAVKLVAEGGFSKASTRAIGDECGINDAYIYRYYLSKEDLFAKAFEYDNERLFKVVGDNAAVLYDKNRSRIDRCRILWDIVWDFLISNPVHCKFYVQFYHSPLYPEFGKQALEERITNFMKKCEEIFPDFKGNQTAFNYLPESLLDGVLHAVNGDTDPEAARDGYFRMVWSSLGSCVKK